MEVHRWRPRAVAMTAGVAVVLLLGGAAPTWAAGTQATDLETNANATPLGIDDATPTLSWRLQSTDRGTLQTSYRVVVATTAAKAAAGTGDVWDSGDVASDRNTAVYAGPALASRTRYHWAVKTAPGGWSSPAWFETAYLRASE